MSLIAAGFSMYYLYTSNQKLKLDSHNYFDENYTKSNNNKILYAIE